MVKGLGLSNHRLSLILLWTFIIVYIKTASSGVAAAPDGKWKSEAIPTSSYSVQRWASHDVASNIQKFIQHEEIRLRVITNFSGYEDEVPFVTRRLSEFKIIHEDLVKNATAKEFKKSLKANHPTTIFAALRNFLSAWENKTENTTIYGERLTEFLEANDTKPLPTRNDLDIVGRGLTVIQATYNLSMADLLKGDVLGNKGEPLSPADCYDISKAVLNAGLLDTAHEWLQAAVSGIVLEKVDQAHLTFNLSDALAALAKIAYKKKDQDKALKLFEKAVELDPENWGVYQDYVKHRFGRDVDPISELDREKVEPWRKKFFDMCQNSTNVTWLEENKKLLATKLKCRLRSSKVVPYRWYKEEILSKSPYISVILDFMSEKEVEKVKNVTLHELEEKHLPGNNADTLWQYKGNFFKDHRSDVLRQVSERVGDVTALNISQSNGSFSQGEPIHVIDYGVAGLALPHGDFLKKYNIQYMGHFRGKRHATMQIYLSDVTLGGATVFIEQNITIIPRKGMAVLWYNFMPSGEPESTLFVGTCPLAVGENIVLEKGIWRLPTDPTCVCGLKKKSTHLTVSMIQTSGAFRNDTTAPGNENTAGEDDTAAGGKEAEVDEDDTAAGGKEAEVDEDDTAAGGKEAEDGEDDTAAGGKEAEVGEDDTAAGGKETEAGEDDTAAGGKEAEVGEDDTAAGGKEAEVGEDDTAAGGDDTTTE